MSEKMQNAVECMASLRKLKYAYSKYKEAIIYQLQHSYIDTSGEIQCRDPEAESKANKASARFADASADFIRKKGAAHDM